MQSLLSDVDCFFAKGNFACCCCLWEIRGHYVCVVPCARVGPLSRELLWLAFRGRVMIVVVVVVVTTVTHGATFWVATANHTDTTRLAAHAATATRCVRHEYGQLPPRMRLVVLAVSTFGAIGKPGQTLISELGRRTRGKVPPLLLGHASWAVPRLGPMIRMALTLAVRRGVAASIHRHWRRGRFAGGGGGGGAAGDLGGGRSGGGGACTAKLLG